MPEPLPPFDLDQFIPFRLAVIASRLSANLATHYKTRYGISIAEWRVLLNLGYSGDISVRDIEKRVSLDRVKVSRAASKLAAKGYITKTVDAKDRRLLKMTLTNEGRALLKQLIPIAIAYQNEIEAALGGQSETLHSALDRLMDEPA